MSACRAGVCALWLALAAPGVAGEWSGYRGCAGDALSEEKDWSTTWPAAGPPKVWDQRLDRGYGAVAIAGTRLYALASTPGSGPCPETVYCRDLATGNEIWRQSYTCTLGRGRTFSACTPKVVGDRVYTYGQATMLSCFDAADGKVLWQRDLAKELQAAPTSYGYTVSPVVADGVVVVPMLTGAGKPQTSAGPYPGSGGVLVAFDARTGQEKWRVAEGCSPWSSPIAGPLNGRLTVVHLTGVAVIAVEPASGRLLWKLDHRAQYGGRDTAASPVLAGDRVIVPVHTGRAAILCVGVKDDKPTVLWTAGPHNWFHSGAVHGNCYFAPHGAAAISCLDLHTGRQLWATPDLGQAMPAGPAELPQADDDAPAEPAPKGAPKAPAARARPAARGGGNNGGAFIIADGKILLVNGRGELIVAAVDARGYKVLAKAPVLGPDTGQYKYETYPTLLDGRVYCRNGTGQLVCVDVRKRG